MPTQLDKQLELYLSVDPPLWTLSRQIDQHLPSSNIADRIERIDTSFRLLLKKLWLPIAERILHYVELSKEEQDLLKGDESARTAEKYFNWTNESAKRIIIAEAAGEKPTWDQLCEAPTLTRAKEVSLLVGFHSGSKTNELATKKGQFDQVIGSYDSNDTV
ncbi:hypothetical protein JCM5350_000812, partial [Sporobolomyces pararoseus]